MKKKFIFIWLALVLALSTIAVDAETVIYSWEGEWESNWGTMVLTQEGITVTGTYTHDDGKITGIISGNKLIGTWSEAPTYAPDSDAGDLELEMSSDGKSFTGKWRYGSSGSWGSWQGGVRTTAVIAAPTQPSFYSDASKWAEAELNKAGEYGLIPASLLGADMTRPITREEFAELSVKLYEKTTGKNAIPASPNPFIDTTNLEVLKAFKLGITTGTSATTFAPKELTTREQVATMLSRAIRTMAPNGDFSTTGAPTFIDHRDISSWALEHVMYMSKLGIIKGTDGKFMPKATTTTQQATGYATTTREQALAMSVRTFEVFITDLGAEKPPTPPPPESISTPKDIDKGLVGSWTYSSAVGNVGLAILIEFRADGTFTKVVGSVVVSSYYATSFDGNYKISGDKLVFYNQLKGTAYASSWSELWKVAFSEIKDIPVEDEVMEFNLTDGVLVISDTIYEGID